MHHDLEGGIPWASVTHAYGEASDVPAALRALSSADAAERDGALYHLYGTIYHQGTVYEATAYAVPYLLALVSLPAYSAIPEVLHLLQAIARGTSFRQVHEALSIFAEQAATPEWQAEKQRELRWVEQAHAAVREGLPVYRALARSTEAQIQQAALEVLGCFPERSEDIVPLLHEVLAQPLPVPVSISALTVLGVVSKGNAAERATLEPYLAAGQVGPIRYAAALTLAHCCPGTIPEPVRAIFVAALRQPRSYINPEAAFAEERLVASVLAVVDQLPSEEAFELLVGSLRQMEGTVSEEACVLVMLACFDLAWYGERQIDYGLGWRQDQEGRVHRDVWTHDQTQASRGRAHLQATKSPGLTAKQRTAIDALLACTAFWGIETNALDLYGLPRAHEELEALLHR